MQYCYTVGAVDVAGNESAQSAQQCATTPDGTDPSVPSGLGVAAVSGSQVDLTWTASTDNVGVTGYKVYRGGVFLTTVVGTSHSDMGRTAVTQYCYTVSAIDFAGNESDLSTQQCATTPEAIPPSVPAGVGATAVSPFQVDLTWTASTDNVGVTGYKIYHGGVYQTTVIGTSHSDMELADATQYCYTVSAVDAAGNESTQSAQQCATTPDGTAPSVPSALGATAVSSSQIDLMWTASTDNVGVTGYKIYRGGAYQTTVSGTSHSDSVLAEATQYCYTVSAVDAAGNESAQSTQQCATPDVTAPSVPTGLGATAVSPSQVDLTWTASTDNVGVTGYKIYRGGVYQTTVAGTSHSDSGLAEATQYCYTVSAVDAADNESVPSTQKCAATPDVTDPSAPSGLGATAASAYQIDLSWMASTDNVGVTGYKIYRGGVYQTTVVGSSHSDTGLTRLTQYCYTVSAIDAAGNESAQSAQQCATTLVYRLPDTGQTSSYTTTFGEDHDYLINPPSYTDNGDGTVVDNNTGLIWQQTDDNLTRTWTNAGTYCTNLTTGSHTDWRLPSIGELQSIVNYGTYSPAINSTYFPGTNSSYYWSSTTYAGSTSSAWDVGFTNGYVNDYSKTYYRSVRCVRGGGEATAQSLTDNADGTVTDNVTGLVWQQQDDDVIRIWEQAITYCEGLSLAGSTDWRLPNINELRSIVDYGTSSPAINGTYFPGTDSSYYWSSTTYANFTSSAWYVDFGGGNVDYGSKSYYPDVRCVRGGQ
jgi:chitodextrinase